MKTIKVSFNGEAREVEAWPDEPLLDVLRETFKLKSLKSGCAPQRECGACLALIDGQPKVTCAVRIEQVEGRSVTRSKASPTTSGASTPTPSRPPPGCNAASAPRAWCCASSG